MFITLCLSISQWKRDSGMIVCIKILILVSITEVVLLGNHSSQSSRVKLSSDISLVLVDADPDSIDLHAYSFHWLLVGPSSCAAVLPTEWNSIVHREAVKWGTFYLDLKEVRKCCGLEFCTSIGLITFKVENNCSAWALENGRLMTNSQTLIRFCHLLAPG